MQQFDGTTIVSVRRDGMVAIGGDGQVTMGSTIMKANARKVRQLAEGRVIAGFAGGTADAFTLFELFETKLTQYGNLTRAAIELAKDWRTDRYLRRLEAMMLVADKDISLLIAGTGDVLDPPTFEEHHGNVDPPFPGGHDPGAEALEVRRFELLQIEARLAIRGQLRSGAAPGMRSGAKSAWRLAIVGAGVPAEQLPAPEPDEVVVVANQELEVRVEIERRRRLGFSHVLKAVPGV